MPSSVVPLPSCFNTQPPEGGWGFCAIVIDSFLLVSTHSRPKAAGAFRQNDYQAILFQHTAARRRLGIDGDKK